MTRPINFSSESPYLRTRIEPEIPTETAPTPRTNVNEREVTPEPRNTPNENSERTFSVGGENLRGRRGLRAAFARLRRGDSITRRNFFGTTAEIRFHTIEDHNAARAANRALRENQEQSQG